MPQLSSIVLAATPKVNSAGDGENMGSPDTDLQLH